MVAKAVDLFGTNLRVLGVHGSPCVAGGWSRGGSGNLLY